MILLPNEFNVHVEIPSTKNPARDRVVSGLFNRERSILIGADDGAHHVVANGIRGRRWIQRTAVERDRRAGHRLKRLTYSLHNLALH